MVDQPHRSGRVGGAHRSQRQRLGHERPPAPAAEELVALAGRAGGVTPAGVAILGKTAHRQRLGVDPPAQAEPAQAIQRTQAIKHLLQKQLHREGAQPPAHRCRRGQIDPRQQAVPVTRLARPADRPIVQDRPEGHQQDQSICEHDMFRPRTTRCFLLDQPVKCPEQFVFHDLPPCMKPKASLEANCFVCVGL